MFKVITAFITFLLYSAALFATPTQWHTLSPGLEYTKLSLNPVQSFGFLHAFLIDPKLFKIEVAFAQDYHLKATSVFKLGQLTNAIIAINGGFFSPDYKPLGLRIQQQKVRSSLKNVSWWPIFIINDQKPAIVPLKNFTLTYKNQKLDFAIQAGPSLIINNQIQKLKNGIAERSAMGITASGKIILACTQEALITTTQLAKLLNMSYQQGGLEVMNAINLDGGSSSQLYAKFNQFTLNIFNFGMITDVIVVKPKGI